MSRFINTQRRLEDVRANCFCASLLRTQIHTPRHAWARALNNKIGNSKADGHCFSFAWIWRSWTLGDPYFSFQNQMLFTIISTLSKNEQKNQCGKLKIFQDFCPRDMEYCHLVAARPVKLWLLLAENISLQRSNCNIFELTDSPLIR